MTDVDFPEFILASRSPRRYQLLREAGYRFCVYPPVLAEPPSKADAATPAQLAEALAFFKAREIFALYGDVPVLGADTIVALGPEVLGKAADEDEARDILRRLSGTRHEVITGLALLLPPPWPAGADRLMARDATAVTMRTLSADEIDAYVASGEWRDKAGAYAIQETGDRFVERIDGSFSNVVGLPLELLARMIEQARRTRPEGSSP